MNPIKRYALGLAMVSLGVSALARTTAARADAPPDAVIEKWHQSWTLTDGGDVVYEEIRHVRLNSDRVNNRFADPRITYHARNDEVEVLAAFTRLADGRVVETPDYGRNAVSPRGASGWPAMADVRELVVSHSGIEPGCIVQFEYRVTRRGAGAPFFGADVRLDDEYPVRERSVHVNLPDGVTLKYTGQFEAGVEESPETADGATHHRWAASNLPAAPVEPRMTPRAARGVRLAFTTAASSDVWLAERLGRIESAAMGGGRLVARAKEWTQDAATDADKLRAIAEQIGQRVQVVDVESDAWRAPPRAAEAALFGHYGTPAEVAGLYLAMARSVGVQASPAALSTEAAWSADAPLDSDVRDWVVVTAADNVGSGDADGAGVAGAARGAAGLGDVWHATTGRMTRVHAAGCTLLTLRDGTIVAHADRFAAWTRADESRCLVTGGVKIDAQGHATGDLSFRTSGLFVDAESLRSADAQRDAAGGLARFVLPGAKVERVNVRRLSDDAFDVDVTVSASTDEIAGGARRMVLFSRDRVCPRVDLPLDAQRRESAVRLVGAFVLDVRLTLTPPEGATTEVMPATIGKDAARAAIGQSASQDGAAISIQRRIRIESRDLSAEQFLGLRPALNQLRSAAGRTVIFKSP